jgi:hypothetical protein
MSLTSQTTFVVCLWIDSQNYYWFFHYKALTFVIGFSFAILMKTGTVSTDILMWFFTLGEFVQSIKSKQIIHSLTQQPEQRYTGIRIDKLVYSTETLKNSPANIVNRPSSLFIAAVLFTVFQSFSVLFCSILIWRELFFMHSKTLFNRHLKLVLPTNFSSCPRVFEFLFSSQP